jgi:hypothetical protein
VPKFTIETWAALCQIIIFPACWWAIRNGGRKIVKEIHEAVDARADAIALKRVNEVRVLFEIHEKKDEDRHEELRKGHEELKKLIQANGHS